MHITMVKKIKADGSPCRKCLEVEQRLAQAGLLPRIDRTVIADEGNPSSEGMVLAQRHAVDVAPFFVVDDESGAAPRVYTSYFRFVKEVLRGNASEQDEASELLDRTPGLDFL
jgi:hypothetical protein